MQEEKKQTESSSGEAKVIEEQKVVTPEPIVSEKKEEVLSATPEIETLDVDSTENKNKPVVNIDADSVVVNENVITDDEFFDDFFSEDE